MTDSKKHLINTIDDAISLLQAMRKLEAHNPKAQSERLNYLCADIKYTYLLEVKREVK